MTQIINFFGRPLSGKSALCAGVFAEMKFAGFSVECAWDYSKELLYEGKLPKTSQMMIFYQQRKRIDRLLGKVDFILTDSPLLMGLVYGEKETIVSGVILGSVDETVNTNVYVHRNSIDPLQENYNNQHITHIEDEEIPCMLKKYGYTYMILPPYTKHDIPQIASSLISFTRTGKVSLPFINSCQ